MVDPWAREAELLEDEYEHGEITLDQLNAGLRDLRRDYEAAARDAAEDEYESWFA